MFTFYFAVSKQTPQVSCISIKSTILRPHNPPAADRSYQRSHIHHGMHTCNSKQYTQTTKPEPSCLTSSPPQRPCRQHPSPAPSPPPSPSLFPFFPALSILLQAQALRSNPHNRVTPLGISAKRRTAACWLRTRCSEPGPGPPE